MNPLDLAIANDQLGVVDQYAGDLIRHEPVQAQQPVPAQPGPPVNPAGGALWQVDYRQRIVHALAGYDYYSATLRGLPNGPQAVMVKVPRNDDSNDSLCREAKMLNTLWYPPHRAPPDHHGVAKFYFAHRQGGAQGTSGYIHMVLESVHPFVTLEQWLEQGSDIPEIPEARFGDLRFKAQLDLAQALRHMHRNNVVLKGLCPQHIMVGTSDGQWHFTTTHFKVFDFCLWAYLNSNGTVTSNIAHEPDNLWLAPELFGPDQQPAANAGGDAPSPVVTYSCKVDMWSWGVIAYQLEYHITVNQLLNHFQHFTPFNLQHDGNQRRRPATEICAAAYQAMLQPDDNHATRHCCNISKQCIWRALRALNDEDRQQRVCMLEVVDGLHEHLLHLLPRLRPVLRRSSSNGSVDMGLAGGD